MKFDYLIVGAGLYGAVFARQMKRAGKSCLVIDRRDHLAGNIYTERKNGINVHRYGAHIFHTSDKEVWQFVQELAEFNNYINSPVARYKDELYNLPFNMNTFSKMWNIQTPAQAMEIIERQRKEAAVENPANLEEQALSLAGRDVYVKLIKGYTEKQWGRDCTELPSFIIKRLPFRFTFDNNYFNDPYQGIPKGGYTGIVEKLLEGIPVKLGADFKKNVREVSDGNGSTVFEMDGDTFEKVLYTGMIDEFFDSCYGPLEYRSLRFENEVLPDVDNYQGNAVVNYTEREVPFTRIIEHKFFEFGKDSETGEPVKGTIITREYPVTWEKGMEPYYPVNNEKNDAIYAKYRALAQEKKNVLFGGRLGLYKYFDMDKVIRASLDAAAEELG
ncbi:MAG TPA: UDP-galactopyranose mutase [Lachnospiraceae bacterium]|nr:UDP-galactopyranose mutase [Lachnospiraceae bacterium]